jgi:hypothetical protein
LSTQNVSATVDRSACPYLGWRRGSGRRWAAVAFGRTARQARDELRCYVAREGGAGFALILARHEKPEDHNDIATEYRGGWLPCDSNDEET